MGWRVAGAILALPFTITVVVPAVIVAAGGASDWGLGELARAATIVVAVALIAAGLALFVTTVRMFASLGGGTLAPWDPLGATGIAIELAVFVGINAVYLPLVEEPALVRRFGPDYERYMANVGRWIPRLRPWTQ